MMKSVEREPETRGDEEDLVVNEEGNLGMMACVLTVHKASLDVLTFLACSQNQEQIG